MSAPHVFIEEVHEVPIAPIWTLLRDFGGWAKWFPLLDAMRIVNGKIGVGAVRKYYVLTGPSYEEELFALDDTEHFIHYDILSIKPSLPGITDIKTKFYLYNLLNSASFLSCRDSNLELKIVPSPHGK